MATKIGCDNLVYAVMTTEDTPEQAPVYSEVKKAPGVMSLNINPNSATETLFADDGPMEVASTAGKIDVEIQKNELTSQNKADLLGHELDTNGAVVYGDSDVAPWVAIGFRTLKSNGKYRYVWLYKGKFSEPEDNNETKGDGINFQSETINGQFARLNHAFAVNAKSIRPWKYELDADAENANEDAMKGWFKAPVMPGTTVTP
jgi:phi13 family phage major tail protein